MAPLHDAQKHIDNQLLHRRVLLSKARDDTANDLPGEKLGATVEQHAQAVQLALQQDLQAPIEFQDKVSLITAVDSLALSTKGKNDQDSIKDLLNMNLALEYHSCQQPLLGSAHMDVLQRKLSDNLPSSTKLVGHDEAARRQIRFRCAAAKGRHSVQYEGFEGANQLLQILAEQNRPCIKAVLQLPAAGTTCIRATASDKAGCRGGFDVGFDVRGHFLAPLRVEPIPDNKGDIYEQLATLEVQLSKHWDTVGMEVQVDRQGTGAGAALELCYKVMQHLQEEGRGACVIVRWADARDQKLHVILAETDCSRMGMLLLNSPEVLDSARRSARACTGDQRHPLQHRFDRILTATQQILNSNRGVVDPCLLDKQMEYLVKQKVQEHGAIWMPRTAFDLDGSDSDD